VKWQKYSFCDRVTGELLYFSNIRGVGRYRARWEDETPPSHEHTLSASSLVRLAQSPYQRRQHHEVVPSWILDFVFYSLSLEPLPSTSVVLDCLSIIAIDLGCDVSSIKTTTSDERFVHT